MIGNFFFFFFAEFWRCQEIQHSNIPFHADQAVPFSVYLHESLSMQAKPSFKIWSAVLLDGLQSCQDVTGGDHVTGTSEEKYITYHPVKKTLSPALYEYLEHTKIGNRQCSINKQVCITSTEYRQNEKLIQKIATCTNAECRANHIWLP